MSSMLSAISICIPAILSRLKSFLRRYAREILICNLLLFFINLFAVIMQGNRLQLNLWMFDSVMDDAAKKRFASLLHTFKSTMERHNMTYFMYSGTLLGSYRHHGHIFWDDDIDFMLGINDKEKIKEIIKGLGIKYAYRDQGSNELIKIFYRKGPDYPLEANLLEVTWPSIDVSFYLENKTHIWDPEWKWDGYIFRKTDVFPLVWRPFDGILLPSPHRPENILNTVYNIRHCATHSWSHRFSVFIPYLFTADKRCAKLHYRIPFVKRFCNGSEITERLQLYGWTINEFKTTEPSGEIL